MSELVDLVAHLFDSVNQLFNLVRERFSHNVSESFTSMTPKQWIRLVIIVGAYALLRPYIIKMGAKFQEKQMEKQFKEEEERQAEISPNQLRGEIGLPEDSDDEDEQAETTASDWGKKARKRQRNMIKKLLDAEEKRLQELQEDEEDKDIEQYLVG
ncbi:DUF1531-domain-containing protein [Annulohypoxylon maeteangense]|uniref:DUF1531-domain-containing protein n=1 Tax=Annulohypoxylon maeteangense TaxID=1927788 RepID=UPI0020087904|nr:DUF1531-domain-containing protein [Annulohypoxylon maeteangense]KAI0881024.1 DUF1531-domain-containing protein [Annulohypoxylon maeteangense]